MQKLDVVYTYNHVEVTVTGIFQEYMYVVKCYHMLNCIAYSFANANKMVHVLVTSILYV